MKEMLLRDLTKYSRRGILTVRITRIWDHWKPDHSELFGRNFIMIDSQVEINLSLTNPALTKAFTKVDAKFCRAESTFPLVKPGPRVIIE